MPAGGSSPGAFVDEFKEEEEEESAESAILSAFNAGGRPALCSLPVSVCDLGLRSLLPRRLEASAAALEPTERQLLKAKMRALLEQSPCLSADFCLLFSVREKRSFCDCCCMTCAEVCHERLAFDFLRARFGSCAVCCADERLLRPRICCGLQVCASCLSVVAEMAVAIGNLRPECPGCERQLPNEEVALHLPQELRQRHRQMLDTFSRRAKPNRALASWAREKVEDPAYDIVRRARPCPKCGVVIERNGGCSQVACPRCRSTFCFLCGKRLRPPRLLPGLFGGHDDRLSVFGCSCNFLPNHPMLRKTLRRLAFSCQLLAAVAAAPVWLPLRLLRS